MKELIKCDRFQDEGENCLRCGRVITNDNSVCESCENNPEKDEWKY